MGELEPALRVRPGLSFRSKFQVKAILPPPDIDGMEGSFVYRKPATDEDPEEFPVVPIAAAPPLAELPPDRVVLDQGWVRLSRSDGE